MRLRLKFLSIVLAMVAWASPAFAEPVSSLKPTGYVNDFARVLNPSTIAQINDIAEQLDQKAHAQLAVVTVNTLDGDAIENYAVTLYKRWGIGSKGKDHGVLILYAIQDRRGRVEVGYGLEPILPDGKTGGFQREANPLVRSGDYSGGLLLLVTRIAEVIAQDAGVQINMARPSIPRSNIETEHELSPGAIIALIVVVIAVLAVPPLRRLLFYMFLFGGGGGGGYRGGGSSWGGGGGFGGGGGGFGGFGGGSSGGGGSSIGW
jgi:uncharacterized protein